MDEWDERGLEPLFGHQRQWLTDVLDRIGSPEGASVALRDAGRKHDPNAEGESDGGAEAPPRFLVASDLGLLDGRLIRRADGSPRLEAELIPWSSIDGLELVTVTELDDALRHRTRWVVRLGRPRLELSDPPDDGALLDFWRQCVLRIGRPPKESPPASE